MHKNKTFATFLAFLLGGLGAHRFYLYGWKDKWAWLHVASLPLSVLALFAVSTTSQPQTFDTGPLVISVLAAFLEALVIGLTPGGGGGARRGAGAGGRARAGGPGGRL